MSLALEVLADAEAVADRVAAMLADALARPGAVLGLATGATPVPVYRRLVAKVRAGTLSFRTATTFNLDEYVGLAASDPASFHAAMQRDLFAHVDIDPARTHLPDGTAPDLAAEARRYERAIAEAGGIDLLLLGIGRNGHIGFNEPGSPFDSRTRVIRLSEATRTANRCAFRGAAPPAQALTIGIATILEARAIVLAATGAAKAPAVAAAVAGPATPDCPASALQHHPAATLVCDRAAASGLRGA